VIRRRPNRTRSRDPKKYSIAVRTTSRSASNVFAVLLGPCGLEVAVVAAIIKIAAQQEAAAGEGEAEWRQMAFKLGLVLLHNNCHTDLHAITKNTFAQAFRVS